MAKLGTHAIRDIARRIVRMTPDGIRYTELVNRVLEEHPETPKNTIHGSVWDLATRFPNEIMKPSRGLFTPATEQDSSQEPTEETETASSRATYPREEDLYEPFAEWLKNDLDEVTTVVPLGGGGLKGKWGTPDVVGVYKPLASHLIKFSPEVVSAEIKLNPNESVVAFGQAVAYRLFSSKCYVVMPSCITADDLNRLEGLSMLFGLGLVVYDSRENGPEFTTKIRARRYSPDMFYVNEFADRLRHHSPIKFEKLFS